MSKSLKITQGTSLMMGVIMEAGGEQENILSSPTTAETEQATDIIMIAEESEGQKKEEVEEKDKTSIKIKTMQVREESDLKPYDEVEEVVINHFFPEQKIKIGVGQDREELIEF